MEGEESLLDSIIDVENVEDMEDVEMADVEEGELVGKNHQAEMGQSSNADVDAVAQEPHSKNRRRRNKKKNKKKKGASGSEITDINRFVLDTCRRLKEKKSYLVWTAVGCLGVSALSDLVKEISLPEAILSLSVDAIQSCGGQKTADGRRHKTGGGILWSILKARDPNAFKEIMKKGKEFEILRNGSSRKQLLYRLGWRICLHTSSPETKLSSGIYWFRLKQFKQPDSRKAPIQNKETCFVAEGAHAKPLVQDQELGIEERQTQKRPVHDRIRVPVSYDDLIEVEDPKNEPI